MTESLKIKKFIREEEDGTKTTVYAINCDSNLKMHNPKGPALINKKQKIGDYYLYGIKHTKDDWAKKIKLKAY